MFLRRHYGSLQSQIILPDLSTKNERIFSTEKKIIFGSLVMVQTESKTFVELTLIRAI